MFTDYFFPELGGIQELDRDHQSFPGETRALYRHLCAALHKAGLSTNWL